MKLLPKYSLLIKIIGIFIASIVLYLAIYYSYPTPQIEGFSPSVKADVKKQLDTYKIGIEDACKKIVENIKAQVAKNKEANAEPEKDRRGNIIPRAQLTVDDRLSPNIVSSIFEPIINDDTILTNELKVDALLIKLKNVIKLNAAEKKILMSIKIHFVVRYGATMLMLDTLNEYRLNDRFPEDTAFITLLGDNTSAIFQTIAGKQSVYSILDNYIKEDSSEAVI